MAQAGARKLLVARTVFQWTWTRSFTDSMAAVLSHSLLPSPLTEDGENFQTSTHSTSHYQMLYKVELISFRKFELRSFHSAANYLHLSCKKDSGRVSALKV
jgi:hypothetical protein